MRTLMDRLKGEFEINVLSHAWVPTEGIRFHRVPVVNAGSFLSTATFNRNACALLKELRASIKKYPFRSTPYTAFSFPSNGSSFRLPALSSPIRVW